MSSKKRILIIEDDPSIIAILRESFRDKYVLAVAKNGKTGLTKAWANIFDLIILDVELGDISGFTICRKLKKHPSTSQVPVIIASALGNVESTLEGFDSGASDFIHKPFHPEELLKRVEVHLKMNDLNNQLRQQAANNQKAKTEFSYFISSLAHELRSPLNSIIGFSEILNSPDLDAEERSDFLKFINQGGNKLLKLLNDLIDYTKIEADALSIHFSKVNVEKELKELIKHFDDDLHKNQINNKNIIFSPDNSEEPCVISTDIVRFLQIMNNFIENAIKYTDAGTIKVGFSLDAEDQIRFFVEDEGIGMSEEEIANLFNMNTFSTGLIQLKQSGKGLGMALTYNLTKLLGGEITVQSEFGKGSTFNLILPRNFIDDQSRAQEIQNYNWEGKQILIAEDVMVNFLFYQALLKKTNVQLLHAKNGLEVLELLEENDPDLILMDMVMPKMSGLEATTQVRKNHLQIPIIAQSGANSREDKEMIYMAGCNDIINKPIKPHLLLDKINRFFE